MEKLLEFLSFYTLITLLGPCFKTEYLIKFLIHIDQLILVRFFLFLNIENRQANTSYLLFYSLICFFLPNTISVLQWINQAFVKTKIFITFSISLQSAFQVSIMLLYSIGSKCFFMHSSCYTPDLKLQNRAIRLCYNLSSFCFRHKII